MRLSHFIRFTGKMGNHLVNMYRGHLDHETVAEVSVMVYVLHAQLLLQLPSSHTPHQKGVHARQPG